MHGFPDGKMAANFQIYLKSGSGRAFVKKHLRQQKKPRQFPGRASSSNLNQTITAIGFAKYIDALAMVEGNMSAKRMEKEYPLYQLDIGISNMVYPALFSSDGYLLGFVARTVKSRSAEGISFYRPLLEQE